MSVLVKFIITSGGECMFYLFIC